MPPKKIADLDVVALDGTRYFETSGSGRVSDAQIRDYATSNVAAMAGATDDAKFAAAKAAGGLIVVVNRGTPYEVASETLTLLSGTELTGIGRPTIKVTGGPKPLVLSGVTDVRVRGIQWDGNKGAVSNTEVAIPIVNCLRVVIEDCDFNDLAGEMEFIGTTTKTRVIGNRFKNGADSAIRLNAVAGNEVCHNDGTDMGGFIVDIYGTSHDNDVCDNSTHSNPFELVGCRYSAYNNRIHHNHAEGTGDNGISVTGYNNSVMGNTLIGNANSGLYFYGSGNIACGNICKRNNKTYATDNSRRHAGISVGGGFGGTGEDNVIGHNVVDDDQASMTQYYGIKIENSLYTAWAQGQTVAVGDYRTSGVRVYVSQDAGTTGSTTPVHTTGNTTDGNIRWLYLNSYRHATVESQGNIIGPDRVVRAIADLRLDNTTNKRNTIYTESRIALCKDTYSPMFVPVVLAQSAVGVAVTGSSSETALATILIPAGVMGANGILEIDTLWSMTNSANNKTGRIRFGSISGTAFMGSVWTTQGGGTVGKTIIANANSNTSRKGQSFSTRAADGIMQHSTAATDTLDTSADRNLIISGQLATSSETLTLEMYKVTLSPKT